MPSEISIVLPIYRPDVRYLRRAIETIVEQTFKNWDLQLVQRGFDNVVRELIYNFGDRRMNYSHLGEDRHLAEQLNHGIALSQAPWIGRCDQDDLNVPERFERQLAFLRENPDVTILGSSLEIIGEDDQRLGYRRYPCDTDSIRRAFSAFNPFADPSVVVKRRAIVEAGGFRSHPPLVQDYEMWSRIARSGAPMANLPQALVRYRQHPAQIKAKQTRTQLRGVRQVKAYYWLPQMTVRDRLRYWIEKLFLIVPPNFV